MFVEVCLTIMACSSESTMCSVDPVTVAPLLGSTMRTTAGEDGREPVVGVGAPALLEPGPPQATSAEAISAPAASRPGAAFSLLSRRVRNPAI